MAQARIVTTAALLLAALAAAGPADAARPKAGGSYKGKTSQGETLKLKLKKKSRSRLSTIEASITTNCVAIGQQSTIGVDVELHVTRKGRFAHSYIETDTLANLFDPVVVGGVSRSLFDVTRSTLRGRFVSRRRATGTWRLRSLLYDRNGYPVNDSAYDRCDTGSITWTARLKR